MDNFKKCSKCGEVKLLDCFGLNKTRKDGKAVYCKICQKIYMSSYKDKNIIKIKEYGKKYYSANSDLVKNRNKLRYLADKESWCYKTKQWRIKNKLKVNEYQKVSRDKNSKDLHDSYVKGQIKQQTGVPYEHITQDLIETKRLHILIKRKLKDLTK
mgnify:CR=1 FL=1